MAQLFSSENPEMTQNSDNICLEFHFSSNFGSSQDFDTWFIFRVKIKEKNNCSNFGPSGFHAHAFTCEHLIRGLFWLSQGPSCLIFHLSHIAAIPSWNQIYGYSVDIVAFWQGWINGSNKNPIVKIPYFGLDHTKFVFNIMINFWFINYKPSSVRPPNTIVVVPYVIDPWAFRRLLRFPWSDQLSFSYLAMVDNREDPS